MNNIANIIKIDNIKMNNTEQIQFKCCCCNECCHGYIFEKNDINICRGNVLLRRSVDGTGEYKKCDALMKGTCITKNMDFCLKCLCENDKCKNNEYDNCDIFCKYKYCVVCFECGEIIRTRNLANYAHILFNIGGYVKHNLCSKCDKN